MSVAHRAGSYRHTLIQTGQPLGRLASFQYSRFESDHFHRLASCTESAVDPGLSHWQIDPASPLLEFVLDVMLARRVMDGHDGEGPQSVVLTSVWHKTPPLKFKFPSEIAMEKFRKLDGNGPVTIGTLVTQMKINWEPTD